jgi:hypothetical protein
MMPNEQRSDLRQASQTINVWWRVALVVLAAAGLGSGAAAVFVTRLEAGPVALVAAGPVLLMVGASGRLPTRLKVGDNEAVWEAVEGFVSRVANDVPSEQAARLVEALNRLAEVAPSAALPGLAVVADRIAYEQMVRSMLNEAVQDLNRSEGAEYLGGLSLVLEYRRGSDLRFDAAVVSGQGSYIAIEIRSSYARVQMMEMGYIARRVSRAEYSSQPLALLFISNQDPVNAVDVGYLAQGIGLPGGFRYVRVVGVEDLPEIVGAIRSAFQIHA